MHQTVLLGQNVIDDLLSLLQQYNPTHILLVRGKNSYISCGGQEKMNEVFSRLNCRITEFYDFEENPKKEDLQTGLELLQGNDISAVVAIGGGSVLDMAKLLRFFYSYSGEFTGNNFQWERELLPLIAIPTTAGTGSEATHFAVLYDNNVKYSVEHDDMLPDMALVYPPFTYKNPPYLTACTGFDALSQAIESFWNLNANEESDRYAKKAIELLWPNLPLAVNSPTPEIRDKISEGAYWAGKAINITKTTAPHAFSYPFTSYYGYPHGHAVALLFPYIAQYNLSSIPNGDRLCSLLNIKNPLDVEKTFFDYIKNIRLYPVVSDKIFDSELIVSNINLNRLKNNPVAIDNATLLYFIQKLNKSLKEKQ